MTGQQNGTEPRAEESEREPEPRGDTMKDASDEAVRFMQEGDEPGHAGRGDGG